MPPGGVGGHEVMSPSPGAEDPPDEVVDHPVGRLARRQPRPQVPVVDVGFGGDGAGRGGAAGGLAEAAREGEEPEAGEGSEVRKDVRARMGRLLGLAGRPAVPVRSGNGAPAVVEETLEPGSFPHRPSSSSPGRGCEGHPA